jgi:hypothetical protein
MQSAWEVEGENSGPHHGTLHYVPLSTPPWSGGSWLVSPFPSQPNATMSPLFKVLSWSLFTWTQGNLPSCPHRDALPAHQRFGSNVTTAGTWWSFHSAYIHNHVHLGISEAHSTYVLSTSVHCAKEAWLKEQTGDPDAGWPLGEAIYPGPETSGLSQISPPKFKNISSTLWTWVSLTFSPLLARLHGLECAFLLNPDNPTAAPTSCKTALQTGDGGKCSTCGRSKAAMPLRRPEVHGGVLIPVHRFLWGQAVPQLLR